jgi:hypothetical protein
MVTVSEFPEFVCIVPMRSYANLYAVHRRTSRNDHGHARLSFRIDMGRTATFNDSLAPFAVHQDDIYQALVNLASASEDQTWYINPTNGVEFLGWKVPDPDTTSLPILRMGSRYQVTSRDAILRLADFVESIPEMRMKLLMNPVEPLICDFTIRDEKEGTSYLIEHKARTSVSRAEQLLTTEKEWIDPKMNWHFLIHQCGEHLAIHTRNPERLGDSVTSPARLIDMGAPNACQEFAQTPRQYGRIAKSRLRNKWKKVEVYDDSLEGDGSSAATLSGPTDAGIKARGILRSEIQHYALAFSIKFNDQCWKLGLHGCILLNNHPCADAVILEHKWMHHEKTAYESGGILPLSLVQRSATKARCILLKFIPHYHYPGAPSTSQLFELSVQTSFEIPVCSAQGFIFVASTGGIPVPGQEPNLDRLVLLPSDQTVMLDDSRSCTDCDRHQDETEKQWTFVRKLLNNEDMESMLKLSSKNGRLVPLTRAPFLKSTARPDMRIFKLPEGEVHDQFCHMFAQGDTSVVTNIDGPTGLLQRQWNHGSSRQCEQRCPIDK